MMLDSAAMCEFIDSPDRIWFPDCPDCGAPRGQSCVGLDGATDDVPHPARMRALFLAYAKTPEFKADIERASELIKAGDTDGLAETLSRSVERRAAEAYRQARGS